MRPPDAGGHARSRSPPRVRGEGEAAGREDQHRYDELGRTEIQLVERTGLSRSTVQRLLNIRGGPRDADTGAYPRPNPTSDVVWLLEDALSLEPGYLMIPTRNVEPMGGRDDE